MKSEISLSTVGLGIILYSPFAVDHIPDGDDYFTASFSKPEDVAAHVVQGSIAAFCTGSGGSFRLVVYDGDLDDERARAAEFKVRLWLEVRDLEACLRDVYDLMHWIRDCPRSQVMTVPDGFYVVTVYSSPPPSGIIGDDQTIYLHLERVCQRPTLMWGGIPQLC
jgi:hypothetical protein